MYSATAAVSSRDALVDTVARALDRDGWSIAHAAFDESLVRALAAEAQAHARAGRLRPAATGRAVDRVAGGLRGDATLWLDEPPCGEAASALLSALGQWRQDLDRRLLLGMAEVEAHFAHYPPGAAYARHRDRFRDDDARVLSLVIYLNADWPVDAGGALRLHLADGRREVSPAAGTSVWFLSDEIEHEVLPATRDRFSIAAWFRHRARA